MKQKPLNLVFVIILMHLFYLFIYFFLTGDLAVNAGNDTDV